MARLGRVLNALIIFLGARIIWQEWRHPARGAGAAGAAGSQQDGPTAGGARPNVEGGPPPAGDGTGQPLAAGGGGTTSDREAAAAASGLGDRQSAAAEARFSPAFPTEIDQPGAAGAATGARAGTGAGSGTSATSAAAAAESGSTDVGEPAPTWAGVPAADAPTARDLDLAEPPAPSAGPAVPAGAVPGDGGPTCPPEHPIKGNASSMIYHQPGQPSYERTVAEFCFTTSEAAEAAGYRPPRR